ncbi:hypothetical protein TVAG_247260 [Trichomonas vaginalis G3]|uniref:Arb2 domain-containing protein n=1 Tax=Trichomonas vaginalis (strain ATCC PRA-98 / G3) TaxID=412133 RepID=A2DKR4_TRIV3|nr:FAM172 family protein-like protein CG10038 family [Trichomonas vaginalis G3]EAY19047.1 hypothetical protein TVAG_247260 [Trichomonas vaginalis G3]KAI5521159.1 FAM172 family protein-like protein CG10038 family [Trichomonas vaginalis G3]|eukprot:XP_001580033.1 hypothetical protein [Trichomonas vaginalis G3]
MFLFKKKKITSDTWKDPGTKTEFHFDENGILVDPEGKKLIGNYKGFKIDDDFSDWLHAYVERRMTEEGLQSMLVPEKGGSPIWFTPNAFKSPKKLLVVICGSGRIHAGILSVGVCAYHGLKMGSALPWIKFAKEHQMEVAILNPNHEGAKKIKEPYATTHNSVRHSLYVFQKLIIPNSPEKCFILAHSAGGLSVCALADNFQDWYVNTIKFTALTDALEDQVSDKTGNTKKYLTERMVNWTRSDQELNKVLGKSSLCFHRSANTTDHPLTTGIAMPFIFEEFNKYDCE